MEWPEPLPDNLEDVHFTTDMMPQFEKYTLQSLAKFGSQAIFTSGTKFLGCDWLRIATTDESYCQMVCRSGGFGFTEFRRWFRVWTRRGGTAAWVQSLHSAELEAMNLGSSHSQVTPKSIQTQTPLLRSH